MITTRSYYRKENAAELGKFTDFLLHEQVYFVVINC